MARYYSQLKALVDSKLGKASGTMTDSEYLSNMNAALDYMRTMVDFPEAEKTQTLAPALFKDVILYAPPTDLYGDGIVDIRPLVELPYRSINNNQQRQTTVEFNNNLIGDKAQRKWAIEYNAGTKYLRILNNLQNRTANSLLNNCDTYNGNGTWTADTTNSDANNVGTDSVNFFEGSGSVKFDITVGQSVNNYATIYNADMASVDVSSMDSPYLFFYVYLPSVTNFSSITMYVGSDTAATPSTKANYYTFTTSTQFDGSAFVAGRNLIGIAKTSATETGSVNDAAIKYLELRLAFTASYTSQTNARVDGIFYREGELYEIRYFTNNLIRSSTGTAKQYFTADDDTTVFGADAELLYVDIAAGYLAPNSGDYTAARTFLQLATESLMRYKSRYPQERKLLARNWYYADNQS